MDFGIMFFSSVRPQAGRSPYRLLTEAARIVDAQGFTSVWTPERHFHEFGGSFPNPALTSAALAMITERIELRAGSLILPLHNPIRAAEDWAVVDNLSGGRVAVSFGSGWNADDFVLCPERYEGRHSLLYEEIELVRKLWRGERIRRPNSFGEEVEIAVFPRPVQRELPVWVTSSGNVETFVSAGRIGANVLTHLVGQDLESLAEKIRCYRRARTEAGFEAAEGRVSLMLHTFLGTDLEEVRARVGAPFRRYLASAISLEQMAALSGGVISGGHRVEPHSLPPRMLEELLDVAFDRYFGTASLMGTPESCRALVWSLDEAGVDEVACLIDFIDDPVAVLESLELLADFRASFTDRVLNRAASGSVDEFLEDPEA